MQWQTSGWQGKSGVRIRSMMGAWRSRRGESARLGGDFTADPRLRGKLVEVSGWRPLERAERTVTGSIVALRRLDSGRVNDSVAWLVFGLTVIGGTLALA
jgi:hypothetical protein